jgi:hypothetical protein
MKYQITSNDLTVDTFLDLLRHAFKTHGVLRINKAALYFNPAKKGEVKLTVSKDKLLLQNAPPEELKVISF